MGFWWGVFIGLLVGVNAGVLALALVICNKKEPSICGVNFGRRRDDDVT